MRFPFEDIISSITGSGVNILSIQPMGGGSINEVQRVLSNKGAFVFKINHSTAFPEMFKKEIAGLQLLRTANEIKVPEIISEGILGDLQYLILSYIQHGAKKENFWTLFGKQLAALHQHHNPLFGLDHDNYIGSLVQQNTFQNNWIDFFILNRLQPQVKSAHAKKLLDATLLNSFESLYKELPSVLPSTTKACLLHGDLWSGNFIADQHGNPVLLDPAVYYGNHEAELAFTGLFGGFDASFYSSYNESSPLAAGYEERFDIYNLYPLLVHLNLFGSSYLHDIKSIVKRF